MASPISEDSYIADDRSTDLIFTLLGRLPRAKTPVTGFYNACPFVDNTVAETQCRTFTDFRDVIACYFFVVIYYRSYSTLSRSVREIGCEMHAKASARRRYSTLRAHLTLRQYPVIRRIQLVGGIQYRCFFGKWIRFSKIWILLFLYKLQGTNYSLFFSIGTRHKLQLHKQPGRIQTNVVQFFYLADF